MKRKNNSLKLCFTFSGKAVSKAAIFTETEALVLSRMWERVDKEAMAENMINTLIERDDDMKTFVSNITNAHCTNSSSESKSFAQQISPYIAEMFGKKLTSIYALL